MIYRSSPRPGVALREYVASGDGEKDARQVDPRAEKIRALDL